MDLLQAKQARQDLETRLLRFIQGELDKFEEETGLTVTKVEFDTLRAEEPGGKTKLYFSSVKIISQV